MPAAYPPVTPVTVKPSRVTWSAKRRNAPSEEPTIDSGPARPLHAFTPDSAPRKVRLLSTTTSSGYVPASTEIVSPSCADETAGPIVPKLTSTTPLLPKSRCTGPAPHGFGIDVASQGMKFTTPSASKISSPVPAGLDAIAGPDGSPHQLHVASRPPE